ncbi:MAG: ABC transporter permease, partial [Terriglobales bacterium]
MALLASLLQDLRYAARMLRRQRGLSTVIVLTLALAIGANTAIFSLMDALLLQSLPVRDPQGLMLLQWSAHKYPEFHSSSSYGDCQSDFQNGGESTSCSFSVPFYDELRQQAHSLAAVTASGGGGRYILGGHGQASNARALVVAGNYFSVLGVRPDAGRMLAPADDQPGAPVAMVLSYAYWQSAFGGAAGVVGQTVALNNVPVTIVGVAERRFTSLTPGGIFDGWLPLAAQARLNPRWNDARRNLPSSIYLTLFARLRPGFTAGQAQAEVSGMFRNAMLAGSKPLSKPGDNPRVELLPSQTGLVGARGQYTQPLTVLMWTVGAILLIACANVA